jgi:hypothetical protein
MKIIDKTPLQDAKGEISTSARIQGTLKYGLSWYNTMLAQKPVMALFNQTFEKGYVLIRNFTLPGSEIVIPMILLAPSGTYVMVVSDVKGFFEAKGDQWNEVANNKSSPASINLLQMTVGLTKAFQKYLQKFNINLPGNIESILICANPGAHVDSVRPLVRVIKSDAIKQFAISITQNRAIMRNEQVNDYAERIIDPRPVEKTPTPPSAEERVNTFSSEPSRAQSIFNSAQNALPFEENSLGSDLSFSFDEDAPAAASAPRKSAGTHKAAPKGRRIMGMTTMQFIVIVFLFLMVLCVLGVAAYIILTLPPV